MRLLVVDDCPALRMALRRLLDGSIEVIEATNGLEGWSTVLEYEGQFDIIVTDMTMPELDGKGFFLKIQEAYPELAKRVVFQTGETDHMRWLYEQGQPVLSKPYSVQQVWTALNSIVPDLAPPSYSRGTAVYR